MIQGRYSLIINAEMILKWFNSFCLISLDDLCDDSGRSHDTMILGVENADKTSTQPFMRATLAKSSSTSWLFTVIPFLNMETMCSYGSNNGRAVPGIVLLSMCVVCLVLGTLWEFGKVGMMPISVTWSATFERESRTKLGITFDACVSCVMSQYIKCL